MSSSGLTKICYSCQKQKISHCSVVNTKKDKKSGTQMGRSSLKITLGESTSINN